MIHLVNGKALLLGGKVHLFYNTYGNGWYDALCHATSDNGLRFTRNPGNPILRPAGAWNSGRAIDCDAFEFSGKLWLIYATRDPAMQTHMLVAATADLASDFGRTAWTPAGAGPILKPELPWETRCIEAPSVIQRGDTLCLFYGGDLGAAFRGRMMSSMRSRVPVAARPISAHERANGFGSGEVAT